MPADDRPNILLLLPHDLGCFLNCFDHTSVRSSQIDGIAAEGVRFERCFTTCAECTPSRGSLLTGLMPHQNGLMGLSNFGWSLTRPHLAALLRDAGYATHQFGLQHETSEPVESLGYQHVHHEGGNNVDAVCRNVADFLRGSDAREGGPWFACAGFRQVHRPWVSVEEASFSPEDVNVPPWLPDRPEVRGDLACFHHDIAMLDDGVGVVRAALKESGLDRSTLLIFTADHGAPFPGAKATPYDPGLRVPLILHWPGRFEGGRTYDELVSNMDLLPALLDLARAPKPDDLAGRSLLPLLDGGAYERRDAVFGAGYYDVSYDPMHTVRTETHKYIRSFAVDDAEARGADPETLCTFTMGRWVRFDDLDVRMSATWQAIANDTPSPRPPAEELYDLRVDPLERDNLADDPAAREELEAMRRRLREMMEATNSPLLRGHVQPPERQRQAARDHQPR